MQKLNLINGTFLSTLRGKYECLQIFPQGSWRLTGAYMKMKEQKCKKCGCRLQADWKICPVCSCVVKKKTVTLTNEAIVITVFSASVALGVILAPILLRGNEMPDNTIKLVINFAAGIIAFSSIVTAFVKYPKNRAIKVFFWLFILVSISVILAQIIFMLLFHDDFNILYLFYYCTPFG